MKNFKKTLLAMCLAVLLIVGTVFAVIADTNYTGTMEGLNELVVKLDAETGAETLDYKKVEKATKAIATYVTNTPVDPASEGYDAAMGKAYAAAVMCADNYISFEEGTLLDSKKKGLNSAETIIALFPDINKEAEDYVAFRAKADALVSELIDSYIAVASDESTDIGSAYSSLGTAKALAAQYERTEKAEALDSATLAVATKGLNSAKAALVKGEDGLWTTATAGAERKTLSAFLNANPLNMELEGAENFVADLDALIADIAVKVKINLATLDDMNTLSAYDNIVEISEDFSNYAEGTNLAKGFGKIGSAVIYGSSTLTAAAEEDGNKYLLMHTRSDSGATYISYNFSKMSVNPTYNGFVIEMKLKGTDLSPTRVNIEPGGYGSNSSRWFPTNYFEVSGAGVIKGGQNDNSGNTVGGGLSNDTWTHVMAVFNPSDFTISVYVDGQFLTKFSAKFNGNTFDYADSTGSGFRLTAQGADGQVCVDDLAIYIGTGYRNPNKFNEMTTDEKFIYYAGYAVNEDRDPAGRSTAYDEASALIGRYYANGEYLTDVPELMAAVDSYNSIDPDEIMVLVSNTNRDTFIEMVNALDDMERTSANVVSRQREYNKIADFLATYSGKITMDDDFSAASAIFSQKLNKEINIDANTVNFVNAMNRFDMVDALGGKQKYLAKAKALVEDETYPLNIEVYEELKALGTFKDFVAAYDKYGEALSIVESMERDAESDKIVKCVGFISDYKTEAEWIENYDYINRYIKILREVVKEGYFNSEYPGVQEALEILAPMEKWFYSRLQDEHAAVLRGALDKIAENEAYIVKMGFCSYIDRYLSENDVDVNYGDMPMLLVEYDTCREELEYRKEDYADLLVQNAYYFKSLVDTMVLSDTYADVKYYYDLAYGYYFTLDASVEGVAERIAIFDEYTEVVDLAEISSKQFIENVVALEAVMANEASTDDDIYWALAECYKLGDYIEPDIDGVSESVNVFVEVALDYLLEAEIGNHELYSAISMMGSLRAGAGISSIMSVAMKFIFG